MDLTNDIGLRAGSQRNEGGIWLYLLEEFDYITPSIATLYAHTAIGRHSTFLERFKRLIEKTLRP